VLETSVIAAEVTPPQAASVDDGLTDSLAALSRLATGPLSLQDLLVRVAECAVTAIPGADGAGVTLLEKGYADTIVASAPFVAEVDAIQYGIGEGPCITAACEARTVRSDELSRETQWPHFGPRVAQLGVHSVLSIALLTPDQVVGAMNVYAHRQNAFNDDAIRIGELSAVPAAIAVQNAQVLAQAKRLAQQLQTALTSRAVIDQALGIVMSRTGSTAEEAFDRLRELSRSTTSSCVTWPNVSSTRQSGGPARGAPVPSRHPVLVPEPVGAVALVMPCRRQKH
jgi:GAF domain-containing protein